MFFGRDDALIWVEQQIILDRRLLIVHGPDLIGKTSLMRSLPEVLSEHVQRLYFECKPYQGEPLSRSLAALAGELVEIRIRLDDSLRVYDPKDTDPEKKPVAIHQLRNIQEGWVTVPEHHQALWQDVLRVEQRPLQAYEEITRWNS